MSGTTVLQSVQLLRVLSTYAVAVVLAQLLGSVQAVEPFETSLFYQALLAAAFANGLSEHFLSAHSAATAQARQRVLRFVWQASWAAGAVVGMVVAGAMLAEGNKLLTSILAGVASLFWVATTQTELVLLVQNRLRGLLAYGLAAAMARVASVALPLLLGGDAPQVFACMALEGLARALFLRTQLGVLGPLLSAREWGQNLRGMLPLWTVAALATSTLHIDGLLVKALTTDEAFVLFRYAARELPLLTVLANATSKSLLRQVSAAPDAQTTAQLLHEHRRQHLRLLGIGTAICLALVLGAPWFYTLAYGTAFLAAVPTFVLFQLVPLTRVVFPQTWVVGRGLRTPYVRIAALELVVHLSLALLLLPLLGLPGVAVAYLLSNLFEKLALVWLVQRHRLAPWGYIHWPLWAASLLGCAAVALTVAAEW